MSDFSSELFMKPIETAYRQKFDRISRNMEDLLRNDTTCAYGKRIEELDLVNGLVKRFVVDDVGVVRDTGTKRDEQRCKYCGCLVSSFDTHCKSCGAPI